MRFAPGQSGNPAGRQPGTRNKATQIAERLLSDDIEGVCQAVVTAARSGDMTAARIIVERLIPARRTRTIEIDLPQVMTAADVVAGHARVVQAMAEGDISPDEAQARPTGFAGRTHLAAVKAAHKACGVGTLLEFNTWLLSLGLKPFLRGRHCWALNIPRGFDDKLTARPIPPSGAGTY